jgi:DNA-binding HxlR family transcriptional regulator
MAVASASVGTRTAPWTIAFAMPSRTSTLRPSQALKAKSFLRSDCPLSCALDVVGDKWTMLILRDLIRGKSRYNELLGSDEGIPSNILAARLRHLVEAELVSAVPYQESPRRMEYRLTDAGRALTPVAVGLAQWAVQHIPGTREVPVEVVQRKAR